MTNIKIRPYTPADFEQLVKVYQSEFAEPPWDEFKKCENCGTNYGIKEVKELSKLEKWNCKKCGALNPKLAPYWTEEDIKEDLEFAFSQKNTIALVAEQQGELVGFTWGYTLPIEKFPFLNGVCKEGVVYMDEIVVRGDTRGQGIGTELVKAFMEKLPNGCILRTDERNAASMGLFKKTGFTSTNIYDPEYKNRIYLVRE